MLIPKLCELLLNDKQNQCFWKKINFVEITNKN